MSTEQQKKAAQRRKNYVRSKVFGTPERPRLSVFRSNRHLYVQVIDDVAGVTLASVGTLDKGLRGQIGSANNKKTAEIVGEAIAKQAMKVGIKAICFDRNGYKYHGRVKALADAARKTGLAF
ncbi:MAG: 50S ribosomal protein L18 [Phycisphaerae bacterium]|nr:50S ribosomal protein L18 [Phycisphaerae bacterium]